MLDGHLSKFTTTTMLQPVMHKLSSQRIVLASGSPRRKQILENIGLKFEVVPSQFEENLEKSLFKYPYEYVVQNAIGKTLEVAKRLAHDQKIPDLVIGADTVVTMDNKIFEKPRSKEGAFDMLSGFSGRSHVVYTGVVLLTPRPEVRNEGLTDDQRFNITKFHEATEVMFATISADIIRSYIETGEPMDKAGGYGIQAAGGTLIEGIKGDYFNVMGFPLYKFAKAVLNILDNTNATEGDS